MTAAENDSPLALTLRKACQRHPYDLLASEARARFRWSSQGEIRRNACGPPTRSPVLQLQRHVGTAVVYWNAVRYLMPAPCHVVDDVFRPQLLLEPQYAQPRFRRKQISCIGCRNFHWCLSESGAVLLTATVAIITRSRFGVLRALRCSIAGRRPRWDFRAVSTF